jgi:LacI family transcriptional regulator
LKAGKKKVRVQDIAKILKISASTVSRALNDHPRISKETKEKVRQVATRLGYYVVQEQTDPEKTEAVTVMIPSLDCNLYHEVAAGAKDFLSENNYQTFIIDTDGDEEQVRSFFKTSSKYGISGIIHLVSDKNIPEDFYDLPKNNAFPVVTVFEPETAAGVSSVMPDMFQGVDKIMTHLRSLGTTKTGLLLENKNKPEDALTVQAFEAIMEHPGSLNIRYAARDRQKIEHEVNALLSDQVHVIIVKSVFSTLEVMHMAQRKGVKIPDDLLLIAMDTDTTFSGLSTNFSLLKFPAYEMGYEAGRILLEQIENPETVSRTSIIPVSFILKGSAIRMK